MVSATLQELLALREMLFYGQVWYDQHELLAATEISLKVWRAKADYKISLLEIMGLER